MSGQSDEENPSDSGITVQGKGSSTRLYSLALLSISTTLGIVFMNQRLFTEHKMHSLQLLFFHTLCGAITSYCLMRRNPDESTYKLVAPWYAHVSVSVLNVACIGSQNWSLELNDMGSYQMIKLLGTPISATVELFQGTAQFSRQAWMGLLALPVAVGLLTLEDVRFRPFGWIVGFAAVIMAIFIVLYCKGILKKYQQPTLAFHWRAMGGVALLCVPTLWLFDLPVLSPKCVMYIVGSSLLGASTQLTSLYIPVEFTATTYLVVGMAKTVLVVFAGIVLNNDPLTVRAVLGLLLSLWGLGTYEVERGRQAAIAKCIETNTTPPEFKSNCVLEKAVPCFLCLALVVHFLQAWGTVDYTRFT